MMLIRVAAAALAGVLASFNNLPVSAVDSFTQGNGALSASWTVTSALTTMPTVVSNQAQDTLTLSGASGALYTGATFANDQWASVLIVTLNTNTNYAGVILRGRTTSTGNEYRCYVLGPIGATSVLHIAKIVAGTFTDLTSATITTASNDSLLCKVQGTTITAYQNGVQKLQSTGQSDIASGLAGFVVGTDATASDTVVDNFAAGNVQ